MVDQPGFSRVVHIAITVRDMEASAQWYTDVFGLRRAKRVDVAAAEIGHPRILLRRDRDNFLLGIHEPHERSGDDFDEDRTGLDHTALEVDDRAALEHWVAWLDAKGVDHSPIRDLDYASFVSFCDPDGIAWEVWFDFGARDVASAG